MLASKHGVGELRRGARGTDRIGRRQLRRLRRPSRSCTGCPRASSPSSPRPRPPSRWGRSGRPRGPRRRRRGSPRAVGSPGPPPSAGCASGRTLRHLPEVAEAWREGDIGVDQARAIASARRHRTEASMARDEAMLVSQAAELGFEDFYRALSYWKQLADPDGAEASDEERKASRNVFLEAELRRDVAGPDDARPRLGLHRGQASSTASSTTSSRPTAPRPRSAWAARPDRRAGPHLGPAPGRRPRRDGHPQPHRPGRRHPARPALLASSSATRPCTGASASSRTAPCCAPSALAPWMDSAYFERAIFSLGQPRRRQRAGPALQRWDPTGHRAARPHLHPPATATSPPRTARPTTSRPMPKAA